MALWTCAAWAGEPIPADKRITAAIAGAIEAPNDQPMHMPTDVAVDSKGRAYVADGANDRVLRFDVVGKLDDTITSAGEQKLKRPTGVAVDGSDQLWIADTGNHSIVTIDADGRLVAAITPLQVDSEGPASPTDLAFTPDGKRTYVVDNAHHRVLIRDNETRKWKVMGEHGRALGQFQYPFMVCIGAGQDAYISEAIGSRIQRISPQNRWAGQIGRWGVELGQFFRPKGVAADAQGRLFVSDSTLGVIQVFGERGVEGVLTDADGKPLRFAHPMGMCFDKQGRLYVVELKANRVAIVSLGGKK